MRDTFDAQLERLSRRLEAGAREYGNRSARKRPHLIERELHEELIDLPGWIYVMWLHCYRKVEHEEPDDEPDLRRTFLEAIRHRALRNDRGVPETPVGEDAYVCMADLEILAVDLMELGHAIERRLQPLVRRIEVVPHLRLARGRRGGQPGY